MIEFNPETHEYFSGGKKLISVTQLMRKHGLAPDYSGVPDSVLAAKAERGTLVHKEIETYIKTGEIGFTAECVDFAYYCWLEGIKPTASETIVYNDIAAGTIDLVYIQGGKRYLADYKTTAALHADSVAWQLSIYKALFGKQIDGLKVFHFPEGGTLSVRDIPEKPAEEVSRLLQCERDGVPYTQALAGSGAALAELAAVEALIKVIDEKKKEAEARAQELRAAILDAMKKNAVTSYETDSIHITYVAPYTRASIDTARLKKERPEVYAEYQKETTVKETLKITLKE